MIVKILSVKLTCLLLISLFLPSASLAAYNYSWDLRTDYAYAPAKLSESSITPALTAQMDQVDTAYNISETYPNSSGNSSSKMQEIDDLINIKYSIVRNSATGELTARPITIMDNEDSSSVTDTAQPASFNGDWIVDVRKICDYYASASSSQTAKLEQAYFDMIELLLNHNILPGYTDSLSYGNGYTWRNTAWKTLRMSHTLPDEQRNLFALSMFFCSGGGDLLRNEMNPHSSTDRYHTGYTTAFYAISRMTDNAFKFQLLTMLRKQLDRTIIGTAGNNCLITIDGGIVHHTGHHISYAAYSFTNMVKPHRILTGAGFVSSLTPESIKRFRQAALSWAWADTNGDFSVHYEMRAAHPSSSISGGRSLGATLSHLKLASELTAAYYNGDYNQIAGDLEMAYPAIVKAGEGSSSLPSQWKNINLPYHSSDPKANWYLLDGHNTFQVNGGAFHRRDNWLASIRGAHTYRRGGEAYDAMGMPDHHHEQSMRGSLLLITEALNGRSANSADSGYFYEGWDHNYYPNVTNRVEDLFGHLYWRKSGYFSGAATMTGGANLFDNGVWFYVPTDGTQRKSAFFFGNRITLVTSDITYASNAQPVVTGLIQQGHSNFSSNPIELNGEVQSSTGQWTLPAGGDHKAVDINGNGYYIHPNAKTPAIQAIRSVQGWPYGLSNYYIGPGSMPTYVYRENFVADVDAGYFNDTTGNYSKVYFDHGTNPANDFIAYTVLVKPAAGELDTFINDMKSPSNQPLTLDTSNDRHLLYDTATDTYAAVTFTDDQTIDQGGLISTSRIGAYMWQTTADNIRLSCGSSNMADTSPFDIAFDGNWMIDLETDTAGATAAFNADTNTTTVTLPYREFARQYISLIANDHPPKFISDLISKPDAREGIDYNVTLGSLADDIKEPIQPSLSFQKVTGPAWLTVAPDGSLSGIARNKDTGLSSFIVRVTDSIGRKSEAELLIYTSNTYTGEMGLSDFAGLARHWQDPTCNNCQQADLTNDSKVNATDLKKFAEMWLIENN